MRRLGSRTIPPILPVLDAGLAGDRLLELTEQVAAGGAEWIEFRDKVGDDRGRYERAVRVAEICARTGLELLVNDRADVALAVGARGVHLGQRDLPPDAARKLLGPDAVIGLSVDTADEAQAAVRLAVDYVALGPIFATASKHDTGPVVGVERLHAVRAALDRDMPLVAIGGITPQNAAAVTTAGGDCVAVVSSILGARDPAVATADLLRAAREGLARRRDAGSKGAGPAPRSSGGSRR